MRQLFTSFTGLLHSLAQGEAVDLESGLFFFGCSRSHVLAPWMPAGTLPDGSPYICNEIESAFPKDPERGLREHGKLVKALIMAEHDGRVAWAKNDAGERIADEVTELIKLLQFNGEAVPADVVADGRGAVARWFFERAG